MGRGRRPLLGACARERTSLRAAVASRAEKFFSDLEDTLVATPGNLKSVPPSDSHLVFGPNILGDLLRDLRSAAHAFCQRPDHLLSARRPSSARPIPDAVAMAAELKGGPPKSRNWERVTYARLMIWAWERERLPLEVPRRGRGSTFRAPDPRPRFAKSCSRAGTHCAPAF